jgi:hypothetical protein
MHSGAILWPVAFEQKEKATATESSPPTRIKTHSEVKLILDWIIKLQAPTKKDATLISIGSEPGAKRKNQHFPLKTKTLHVHSVLLHVKF